MHRQSIDLSEQSRKERADNMLQGSFTRGQNYGLALSLVMRGGSFRQRRLRRALGSKRGVSRNTYGKRC